MRDIHKTIKQFSTIEKESNPSLANAVSPFDKGDNIDNIHDKMETWNKKAHINLKKRKEHEFMVF